MSNNEWYTPPHIVEVARECMGSIDCDPASCDAAQKTVGAATYYTKDSSGLSKPWIGNVFLNPPYSRESNRLFLKKLQIEIGVGNTRAAFVLLNTATDTAAQQWLLEIASVVCFVRGRVAFIGEDAIPAKQNRNGQVIYLLYCDNYEPLKKLGVVLRGVGP